MNEYNGPSWLCHFGLFLSVAVMSAEPAPDSNSAPFAPTVNEPLRQPGARTTQQRVRTA
jgi:hypothetical protein